MKIKSVSIRYGRKYNLGDYESIEMETFLHAEIDEEEDEIAVGKLLTQQAKTIIKNGVIEVLKASQHQINKAQETRRYMGKVVADPNWSEKIQPTQFEDDF